MSTLEPKRVNACSICAEALEFAVPDALCGVCCRVPPNFDFAISFSAYDGSLRKLLHLLKYEQLRPAANLIGAKLAEAFAQREFAGKQPVRLIPVPLHRAKRRQRGFNQSERIARSVLQHLDTSRFELHAGNRRRVRATVSQTGLTRHQRRENVRGAFAITAPEQVRDRSVIIVDDVYTGTTLNECARVLRKAGAAQVVVATAARVYRTGSEIKLTRVETQHAASQAGQEENATAFTRAVAG
ncbi:MAG TPA: ComF family protein [Terriglobales bacterium]|nr:ComF family protein [Terriglobales bacterium]